MILLFLLFFTSSLRASDPAWGGYRQFKTKLRTLPGKYFLLESQLEKKLNSEDLSKLLGEKSKIPQAHAEIQQGNTEISQENTEIPQVQEEIQKVNTELPQTYAESAELNRNIPAAAICLMDETDRLPGNLAQVVEYPKKFIFGPDSAMKAPKKHAVIVGAGIAGLISAYLLLSVGHQVTLLEGSDRVGGRIYTVYRDGYYGDMGAMRFPQYHLVAMKVIKLFNVKTDTFSNYWQGSEGNYLNFNGKHYYKDDLDKQETIRELYAAYNFQEEEIPKDEKGKLRDPRAIIREIIQSELKVSRHCTDDHSFHGFLRERLIERGLSPKIIILYATMTTLAAFLPYSADEFITDSDTKELHEEFKHLPLLEIVNGSSQLPFAIFRALEKYPEFKYIDNANVYKIDNTNKDRMVIHFDEQGSEKKIVTDFLVITTTAPAVGLMEFTVPLPAFKQASLRNLKYLNSAKIFLKFKSAFWARSENNKAKPILFEEEEGKKSGGVGLSDKHITQTYYPSHPYHGTKLLASYTWDKFADFFQPFNKSEAIEFALKDLEEIHGPVVREEFEDGIVYVWNNDRWSHGAFVFHEPYQKYFYMDSLRAPFGNIHFTGEYTNKNYNGWIEAALESAIRTLVNLHPEEYNKQFMKGEKDFLTRADRKVKRKK